MLIEEALASNEAMLPWAVRFATSYRPLVDSVVLVELKLSTTSPELELSTSGSREIKAYLNPGRFLTTTSKFRLTGEPLCVATEAAHWTEANVLPMFETVMETLPTICPVELTKLLTVRVATVVIPGDDQLRDALNALLGLFA